MGQSRRSLLASLLKVIEQRNGGTLSHLEDGHADSGRPWGNPTHLLAKSVVSVVEKGAHLASGEAPIQSGVSAQGSVLDESRSPTGEMGQMLEQREPGEEEEEEEEDQDQGRETDVELRRRREAASQVLIHADVRVASGAFLLLKLLE